MSTPDDYQHDQRKIDALAEAMQCTDTITRLLIIDELTSWLPEYEEKEAMAASALRIAVDALKPYQDKLDAIDAEISQAQDELAGYQRKATPDNKVSDRVAARLVIAEYERQIADLGDARSHLATEIGPYATAADEAKKALAVSTEERGLLQFNIANPATAYYGYGQKTIAYEAFRVTAGHLVPLLLTGNNMSAEMGPGLELLEHLCVRTGYRTNHIDEQAAQRERRYWDAMHDDKTREDFPHAQEIIARTEAEVTQMVNHERNAAPPRDKIEDYRDNRPELRLPWRLHGGST